VSEDLNRDPLLQKLARLTPSSSAIDRDALLFAAGRASAPRTNGWKILVVGLALSQAATLGLWFMTSGVDALEQPAAPPAINQEELLPVSPESPIRQSVSPQSYASLTRRLERGGLPMPEPVADPLPPQPALSADLRAYESSFE
jgi:hypothetical protein